MDHKPQNTTPSCIGIIMDGNRRFAKERGLPAMEGHRRGYAKAKEAASWCRDAGIKYLVLYAFSTENWSRSKEEISYLTGIFRKLLWSETNELRKENGAVRFLGDIGSFGADFERQARLLEESNPKKPGLTVALALSYGGRPEIIRAANNLLAKKAGGAVTEKEFSAELWTAGIPDPELVIRTGGEKRLSNFLTWQSVYSELFFTDTYWPEFTEEEFLGILKKYGMRERRMGK